MDTTEQSPSSCDGSVRIHSQYVPLVLSRTPSYPSHPLVLSREPSHPVVPLTTPISLFSNHYFSTHCSSCLHFIISDIILGLSHHVKMATCCHQLLTTVPVHYTPTSHYQNPPIIFSSHPVPFHHLPTTPPTSQ